MPLSVNDRDIHHFVNEYYKEVYLEHRPPGLQINEWIVNDVTNMSKLFYNKPLFNEPLDKWNVSNVTNMSEMFRGATNFNQPINNWNVSKVTNMKEMFRGATSFNQPIDTIFIANNKSKWNVSNVTNMSGMFEEATNFNQTLDTWNVSNVTNMSRMFMRATSFDQPINTLVMPNNKSKWDVKNVTDMSEMFSGATSFNQLLNRWNVSNVIDMSGMFEEAINFNQPLNTWNVSKVRSMPGMFSGATSFNQPINNWDVSSVTDKDEMFMGATSFNQDNYPDIWREHDNQSEDDNQSEVFSDYPLEPLKKSEFTINPSTDVGFDYVGYEDVKISNYLEDKDNIVFYKKINENPDPVPDVLYTKSRLKKLYTDLEEIKSSILYECKNFNTIRPGNVIVTQPYFSVRKLAIQLGGLVKLSQIKEIVENDAIRCVILNPERIKNLKAVASYGIMDDPERYEGMSAEHCQDNKAGGEYVYNIEYFPIDLSESKLGGKVKRKKHKRKTKKRNTKRKSVKRKSAKRK
jgi:surface protein